MEQEEFELLRRVAKALEEGVEILHRIEASFGPEREIDGEPIVKCPACGSSSADPRQVVQAGTGTNGFPEYVCACGAPAFTVRGVQ